MEHTLRLPREFGNLLRARQQLAVDVELAAPAGDQVRILADRAAQMDVSAQRRTQDDARGCL